MPESLKIILLPGQTNGSPGPLPYSRHPHLVTVAGKPLLGHVLSMFDRLPAVLPREFILATAPLDEETPAFIRESFPALNAHCSGRSGSRGAAHDLFQLRSDLSGPVLVAFLDRLAETDLSFLSRSRQTAVAWVRPTADPARGSYAIPGSDGRVRRFDPHPPAAGEKLSSVGMFYFPDGSELAGVLEEQVADDRPLTVDETANRMLARGLSMRPESVSAWLDSSTPAGLLEMNAYLLENGRANITASTEADGVTMLPPAFIEPSAEIEGCIIGPNVSAGPGCRIEGSILQDCIIGEGARVTGCSLKDSIIGRNTIVRGVSGIIIVGDGAVIAAGTENNR